MKSRLQLFYIVLFFAAACTNSPDNVNPVNDTIRIPVIDIDKGLDNIKKVSFKVSEFIEDIQFVKLESSKQAMFGFGNFEFQNSLLTSPRYVYCQLMKFCLKDGKFIQKYGKQGRGPGEYIMHLSSTIDPLNNRIFVLDNYGNQIVVYDSVDNFIKKLNVPDAVQSIKYLGDDKLVLFRFYSWFTPDYDPFEYLILDVVTEQILYTRKIDVIADQMKKNPKEADFFGFPRISHWYYDNKIQLYEGFTDTIYTINTDGSRTPRFYVKMDKYKPPVSEMLDNESYEKNRSKYGLIRIIFETPGLLFMQITRELSTTQLRSGTPESYCAHYNKLTGELTITQMPKAFENDVAFFPFASLQNMPESPDGISYMRIPVNKTEFLSEMEKHRQNWTGSAEKLYEIIQNSNPEDNGIICIYKLKR